jgi:hypothetical protein
MSLRNAKALASPATIALAVGALSFVTLVFAHKAPAQPPDWPQTQMNNNQLCTPSGLACAVCPGPVFGCTSGIPAGWNAGACMMMGPGCNASTFPCGPAYMCTSGMPTGNNCPSPTICQ